MPLRPAATHACDCIARDERGKAEGKASGNARLCARRGGSQVEKSNARRGGETRTHRALSVACVIVAFEFHAGTSRIKESRGRRRSDGAILMMAHAAAAALVLSRIPT